MRLNKKTCGNYRCNDSGPAHGPNIRVFSFNAVGGSGKLLKESITTLIKGLCSVIIVSAWLSFCIPGITVTPEMLARQNPELSAINLTGISLAALIVFYLVKLHPQPQNKKIFSEAQKRALGQIIVSLVLILLISVPLVFFTIEATAKKIENETIHTILSQSIPDEQVYSMEIIRGQQLKINMILLGSHTEVSSQRTELEQRLEEALGKPLEFIIYTIGKAE